MNKFRLVRNAYEDVNEYVCLKCKESFYSPEAEYWCYCPICGTKWDGQFVFEHPRYQQSEKIRKLEEINNSYSCDDDGNIYSSVRPRLIIESLRKHIHEGGWYWCLYVHGLLGKYYSDGKGGAAKSMAAGIISLYNKLVKENKVQVRLRLVTCTNNKILRESVR